jgi:DNA-binding NarL/FixJ family response regulator
MTIRIPVSVEAADPVSRAGVASQLAFVPEVQVLSGESAAKAHVTVLVADSLTDAAVQRIRALRRGSSTAVVCVLGTLDDEALLTAVEAGVSGLVRRDEATQAQLVAAVQRAAAGEGSIPPDVLGRLLKQVGSSQRGTLSPRGPFGGLNDRELAVLRLVAEGQSTREIARSLAYSERTIKNALHELTSRLGLRNRSHAVAYALRQGLI